MTQELIRRFYEDVLVGGDIDALDEIATADYQEHDPLPGQGAGLQGLRDRVTMLREGLAVRFTIEDVIESGDKLVVRWTNSGTHVGNSSASLRRTRASLSPVSTSIASSTASLPSTGTSSISLRCFNNSVSSRHLRQQTRDGFFASRSIPLGEGEVVPPRNRRNGDHEAQ